MKYLVMETHPAYAVMLDENGRFLKAANLRYQVGDTVQEIIELQMPRKKAIPLWKPLSGLAGLAACFCLVFFGYYRPNFTAYGTLRIQINPDVEMTVSRTDRVLDLEGLNEDGEDLIAGYSYRGKDRETTAEELVERAIDMGYLSDGDTISITVTSSDPEWRAREEVQVQAQLEERYGESIVIQLGGSPQQPFGQVVLPGQGGHFFQRLVFQFLYLCIKKHSRVSFPQWPARRLSSIRPSLVFPFLAAGSPISQQCSF